MDFRHKAADAIYQDGNTKLSGMAQVYAGEIARALFDAYPDHVWYITVKDQASEGVAYIRNTALSSSNGYVLHLRGLSGANLRHKAMMAGGEILERYNVRRGKHSEGDYNGHIERAQFQ